jgi:hypothetical protein
MVTKRGLYQLLFWLMKNLIFVLLFAACVAERPSEVFTESGIAIRGYDPVAYFVESKPVKGLDEFNFNWKDATWKFSSSKNLELFKFDPEKFAPQYGGYCAYGTAEGHKAPTQPDAWTIVDSKLYLNYNPDVKTMWMNDQQKLIEAADKNWASVKLQKD